MSEFSPNEMVTLDVTTVLEIIELAEHDRTENYVGRLLVDRLMNSIIKMQLPIGTELLIAAYLSRLNETENVYQEKIAHKLTKELVSSIFYDFDGSSKLNQEMIKICVQKKIFVDDDHNFVTMTLMFFAKKLHELANLVAQSESESVKNLLDYKISQQDFFPGLTNRYTEVDQSIFVSSPYRYFLFLYSCSLISNREPRK